MARAAENFAIPQDRIFTDFDACMRAVKPDLAILCAATADHAEYTERLAAYGCHVFVEKPFAASVADARRMIAAMRTTGKLLAINWPLAWVESHVTAKRLIDEGVIGALTEVHFYDGNRGPLYHLADKVEVTREEVEAQKADFMVVQARLRRRQPARLSRLWRDARHLVFQRQGAHRSDLRL